METNPKYKTEYGDNYLKKNDNCSNPALEPYNYTTAIPHNVEQKGKTFTYKVQQGPPPPTCIGNLYRDPSQFPSRQYESIYRQDKIEKDDRGCYVDPFRGLCTTSNQRRRLMYDTTHPDKMYGSQWSSELIDGPSMYSFPHSDHLKNTGKMFNHDLQWMDNGEVGQWPTESWKEWSKEANAPRFNGYSDQVEYSKYKVDPFSK